ncbi:DUF4382 domain-containing protein [Hymenobacter sp. BT664]|uniref:DUF4382 domain-containing protein n=1 Tax=Hymenobacter montanus TaxID=2771359 RepID=A0A927BF95_9BACT|nr:DUF4382 domain-containing protein [Hymenobacter montanus]MBD2769805.1 DUF4382 domain-containing protein [Hymenobacter montanus]
MKIIQLFPAVCAGLLGLAGCAKNDEAANSARLEVRLMDAPGDFQQVVLDVQQIAVNQKCGKEEGGWKTLNFQPQAINVLAYVNGKSSLLVSDDFAPGDLKEIRLILGPGSYVLGRDEQRYPLRTPSGATSGVKLKLEKATLRQHVTFQLLLDFDVAKSIVQRGGWKAGDNKEERYLLKPVVRVVAQDLRCGLRGTVTPANAQPQILAIRSTILGPDTLSTAADASGMYQLSGLAAGTYRVEFFPSTTAPAGEPAYHPAASASIVVVNGQVTTLDPVKLN